MDASFDFKKPQLLGEATQTPPMGAASMACLAKEDGVSNFALVFCPRCFPQ